MELMRISKTQYKIAARLRPILSTQGPVIGDITPPVKKPNEYSEATEYPYSS